MRANTNMGLGLVLAGFVCGNACGSDAASSPKDAGSLTDAGPLNACGGTGELRGQPGYPCGDDRVGYYECEYGNVVCVYGFNPDNWRIAAGGGAWNADNAGGLTLAKGCDGSLWSWGHGGSGQRGDGTTEVSRSTPVRVVAAGADPTGTTWADWVAVDPGTTQACGMRKNLTMWCWGAGDAGARGDGTTDPSTRTTPTQVLQSGEPAGGSAWTDWADVSVGDLYACGIRTNGTLWCWGSGSYGQRGDGTSDVARATPSLVLAADEEPGGGLWSDWREISVGDHHACGLREGTLWCWGLGDHGERGDGTTDEMSTTPVQVLAAGEPPGGSAWDDWIAVSAGSDHTCGLRSNYTAWCWGRGDLGQLGDGSTAATRTTPVEVQAAEESGQAPWDNWNFVNAGFDHTCGVRAGTVWCWGGGASGQRGDGTTDTSRSTPIQVLASGAEPGGEVWERGWWWVSPGHKHTCGLAPEGRMWCWGDGENGQRGDGSLTAVRTTPSAVEFPPEHCRYDP